MEIVSSRHSRLDANHAAAWVTSLALAFAVPAQAVDEKEPPKADKQNIPIDLFEGVRVKDTHGLGYPEVERLENREGWVNLNFMVDPNGKPYEIMVAQSSGNKSFEESAMKAAKNWTFEPASLNGQRIDSAMTLKVKFVLSERSTGANPEFVRAYNALLKAIKANDKTAADAAMSKLKINNLYEDAYHGAAEYQYAREWGTEAEQLEGLERAIAQEKNAQYLPQDAFAGALQSVLALQIKYRDYASAIYTWHKLEKAGANKATLEKIKPSIDQIMALHKDDRAYWMSGQISEASWHLLLFKRRFQIDVTKGRISQVKLRCDKKFVFFQFDPKLRYEVNDKFGACSVELIGDPGTKFNLVQS